MRGGLFQAAAYLITSVAIPLALTPIILAGVGKAAFGVWAVLLNLGAWMLFLDLGISFGVPKVAGELAIDGQPQRVWDLIAAAGIVWIGMVAAVLSLVWVESKFLYEKFIGGPVTPLECMLFVTVVAHFGFSLAVRIVVNLLNGLQWVAAAAKVQTIVSLAQAVGVLWAMSAGRGLWTLALIYGASSLLHLTFLLALLARHVPRMMWKVDFNLLVRVFSAGGVLYLVYLLAYVFQMDRIYFSWIRVPLEDIADYHIGAMLVAKIAGLLSAMTVAIYPAASSFDAMGDDRRLKELAVRGTKYLSVLGFLTFGFAALFAPFILRLWIGEASAVAVQSTRILSLWGVTAVIGGLTSVGAGLGRPGYQLKSSVMALLLALLIFGWLGRSGGLPGVAWTISLSVFAVAVYYVYDFCRSILPGCSRDLLFESLFKPLVCTAALAPAWLAAQFVEHQTAGLSRGGCGVILTVALVTLAAALVPIAKAIRLFDETDRQRFSVFVRAKT